MAVMTMVAWERADQSGGFSVARRERLEPPDAGWLFHSSEVLVREQTLSCTFRVVVGPDWVTRGSRSARYPRWERPSGG